jgi:hypothetical protein
MKRIWVFVGVGLLLLLLFAWWYSQREWLTDRLLSEIKLGMKREEIEVLPGKRARGYRLPTWHDYDALWAKCEPSKINLIAPDDAWLPALMTNGTALRRECTIESWGGPRVDPPDLPVKWIWVGHQRALILMLNDDGVGEIRAFSVTKSGGGFLSWLSSKWNDWIKGM